MDIRTHVSSLKGKTLRTLGREKPFEITVVTHLQVTICPHSTNNERPIPWKEINGAYQHLKRQGRITRIEIE